MEGPSLSPLEVPSAAGRSSVKTRGDFALPALLLLILLLLAYAYSYIARPPAEAPKPLPTGMTHLFNIYGWGTGPLEQLGQPNDVAFDARGNIYVADSGNKRVAVFNPSGGFIRRFPFAISRSAKLEVDDNPVGITVDDQGRIYAASMDSHKLLIFDNQGKFLAWIRNIYPIKPKAVGNELYLTTSKQLIVYDIKKGEVSGWGGNYGKGKGEMVNPNGIDVAPNGDVYLSDSMNSRIQIIDKTGKIKKVIGRPPKNMDDATRLFGANAGLVLDEQGYIYVVDELRHSIRIFSPQGKHLIELGREGAQNGYFEYPVGIAYRGNHEFAIADKQNDRIQVVRIIPPGARISARERLANLPVWLIPLLILLALVAFYSWYRRRAGRRRPLEATA